MEKINREVIAVIVVIVLAMLACALQSEDTSSTSMVVIETTDAGENEDAASTMLREALLDPPTATEVPTSTSTPTVESIATSTTTMEPIATSTPTEESMPTSTPTIEPILESESMRVNPMDGAVMVVVPEGEFLMGSEDGDAFDHEKPKHIVYLDTYWIYQHPVTNAQFAAFVEATNYITTAELDGSSRVRVDGMFNTVSGAYWSAPEGPSSDLVGRQDHPVVHVSWFDAEAYCEWAGGRLPTEAEWEKAARGTDGRRFPWGNQSPICRLANNDDQCFGGTSPVGSTPDGVSPYGALDMAGNVWEWVADWYAEDYYRRSPYKNPTGPEFGEFRGTRGGFWNLVERFQRVTHRGISEPDEAISNQGFRCVYLP